MTKKQITVNARGNRVGETHHRAKLADKDVAMILELHEAGLSYKQIARKFDDVVTLADGTEVPGYRPGKSTIRDVVKGNTRGQPIAKWRWITTGEIT